MKKLYMFINKYYLFILLFKTFHGELSFEQHNTQKSLQSESSHDKNSKVYNKLGVY